MRGSHKEVQNLVSLSAAARMSQTGRQIEASNQTELQCTGQDKGDTVACEVVHWVQVAKERGQGRRKGEGTCQWILHLPQMVKN